MGRGVVVRCMVWLGGVGWGCVGCVAVGMWGREGDVM